MLKSSQLVASPPASGRDTAGASELWGSVCATCEELSVKHVNCLVIPGILTLQVDGVQKVFYEGGQHHGEQDGVLGERQQPAGSDILCLLKCRLAITNSRMKANFELRLRKHTLWSVTWDMTYLKPKHQLDRSSSGDDAVTCMVDKQEVKDTQQSY